MAVDEAAQKNRSKDISTCDSLEATVTENDRTAMGNIAADVVAAPGIRALARAVLALDAEQESYQTQAATDKTNLEAKINAVQNQLTDLNEMLEEKQFHETRKHG